MMLFNPGTWVVLGVAVVALLALWQGDRAVQRQKGASVAIEKVNTNARKLANEGREARKPAERDGAAERLRQHSCRDC